MYDDFVRVVDGVRDGIETDRVRFLIPGKDVVPIWIWLIGSPPSSVATSVSALKLLQDGENL